MNDIVSNVDSNTRINEIRLQIEYEQLRHIEMILRNSKKDK